MPKQKTIWIVVADGARARILAATGHHAPWAEVAAVDAASGHRPSRDLGSDRPGRSQESAYSGSHAVEPRSDPHQQAERGFIADLAERLGEGRRDAAFAELVLAAPPRALGDLRQALDEPTRALVRGELDHDLTKIPVHALPEHFAGLLPPGHMPEPPRQGP